MKTQIFDSYEDFLKRSEDRLLAFKMCLTWIRANKPKKKVA